MLNYRQTKEATYKDKMDKFRKRIENKIKPFIHPIRWIKEEPRIPLDKILPDQPGAALSKVSILDSVHLFIDKNKKPIGSAISTTGELAGGPLGFALRVAGKMVTGSEKVKSKMSSVDWSGILKVILEFFATIFKKKK